MLNSMQKEIQELENANSNLKIQLIEAQAIITSLQQENQYLQKRLTCYKNETFLSFDSTFITNQFLDTQCDNCEESIPASSIELHTIECTKKLTKCSICNEKVLIQDMPQHITSRMGTVHELEQEIEKGDIQTIEMRIAHGARVSSVSDDIYCNSLMHLAVRHGRLEIVEYFLKRGLDINCTNACGESPLHLVCGKVKDLVMVKYLVSKGAECRMKNSLGDSCIDLAKRYGFHEAVLFFQQLRPIRPSSSMIMRT